MKEAERKLYEKGYYLSNQFDGFGTVPGEYELADRNGNTVIDHLTEAQVITSACLFPNFSATCKLLHTGSSFFR